MANPFTSLVGMLLAAIIVVQPGFAAAFEIGRLDVDFVDTSRGGRVVGTRIHYPADTTATGVPVAAGAFPVVAFAHGLNVNAGRNAPVWEALVPNGYIVALPKTEPNGANPDELGRDLAFVVTALHAESNDNASLFFGHVDDSGSAIGGHSMGGGASVLGAAENPWLDALFNLGALNTGAVDAAANVSMPTLVIGGTADCVTPIAGHQLPIYQNLASDCRYLVELIDGTHCGFILTSPCDGFEGGACPTDSLRRALQTAQTAALIVPWMDAHVKKDAAALGVFQNVLATDPNLTSQGTCDVVGVPDAMGTLGSLRVHPNPSAGTFRISFEPGLRSLTVHDAGGRLVRSLTPGSGFAIWDGRDSGGALVPSGVYWLRAVDFRDEVSSTRLVRLR